MRGNLRSAIDLRSVVGVRAKGAGEGLLEEHWPDRLSDKHITSGLSDSIDCSIAPESSSASSS